MKQHFPWVTLGVGLLLAITLFQFSPLNADATYTMPLLTALLMCEVGFLLAVIGTAVSLNKVIKEHVHLGNATMLVGNMLLGVNFLCLGLTLWTLTSNS